MTHLDILYREMVGMPLTQHMERPGNIHTLSDTENPIIDHFFATRGLSASDAAYLSAPHPTHQHDPRLLRGVDEWVAVLHAHHPDVSTTRAVFAIIPDYDADGVLSGTLARVGLSVLGFGDAFVYAPHTRDGYGLTRQSVDNVLAAQPETTIIVTTDNGSNAHDGIKYAKSKGLTVLVTDHHLADTDPAADAVVNPNRRLGGTLDAYPHTDISGTAVIYKALQAYALTYHPSVLPTLESLVLLVGISTLSDVMPLRDENRYFVTEAVAMLKHFIKGHSETRLMGYGDTPLEQYYRGVDLLVMTLMRHDKLKYGVTSDTFGFTIGPILNSPRRMTGASDAGFDLFRTLRSDLYHMAETPADVLYDMNEARKLHVRGLTADLFAYVEQTGPVGASHTVFNARMGGGIAGLLAGSFTQAYDLPAIAFSHPGTGHGTINLDTGTLAADTLLSGSARSPEFFDLHRFLADIDRANPGLLVKWGGHAQAAGLTIRAHDFDRFRSVFSRALMALVDSIDLPIGTSRADALPIKGDYLLTSAAYQGIAARGVMGVPDGVLVVPVPETAPIYGADIDSTLSRSIAYFDQLAPFGHGFPAPVFSVIFAMADVKVFYMGAEKQHAKLTLPNGLAVIKWNGAEMFRDAVPDGLVDHRTFAASGVLSTNAFGGRTTLQMIADTVVLI